MRFIITFEYFLLSDYNSVKFCNMNAKHTVDWSSVCTSVTDIKHDITPRLRPYVRPTITNKSLRTFHKQFTLILQKTLREGMTAIIVGLLSCQDFLLQFSLLLYIFIMCNA